MDKCIACGECTKKCPGKPLDTFNEGLAKRKAIYVDYPQAVPLKYAIDPAACLKLSRGKCGICAKVCPTGAISYEDTEQILNLNVGSVIMAQGYKPYDPSSLDNYQYKAFSNVVTSIEFERLLSAGGPTGGHIECAPDKRAPKRIAWLQCVGSRDQNKCGHGYCSSVCCMYAVKEAVMTYDHIEGDFNASIFFMDMRTFGKDFETYYDRAKDKGIRFVRSRIHTITENGDKSLSCTYVTEDGKNTVETFDMVVLSVGMETPKDLAEEVRSMGITLNSDNFVDTQLFAPVSTSRDGVYVCGALSEPKDIPISVMEASAAACDAGACLVQARGTQTRTKTYPEETAVAEQDPRIGVFVCNCGTNIGGVVDVPAVADYARGLPHVAYVEENMFTCSQDTQDKIRTVVAENGLNRVVIAACTPRTHEPLFQETLRDAGLNKYLIEMANIRNQCSWVHSKEPELATQKSKDLVRIAVSKAALMNPLDQPEVGITQKGLVIGGGVAGMTAALGLADQGFHTFLLEKDVALGGFALHLDKGWTGEPIAENVRKLIEKVADHPAIEVMTQAQILSTGGFVGNFKTKVRYGGLNGDGKETELSHGAVVIATGASASEPEEYLYGTDDRVFTHVTLDQAIADNQDFLKNAQSAVFIQCVGSREKVRPYCSKVCCTHTIKKAVQFKTDNPEMDVYVLYRDIRTYGQRERLYREARDLGVIFMRYDVDEKPVVKADEEGLTITLRERIIGMDIEIRADFLVLASAIEARGNEELAQMFKLTLNDDKFFMEAHAKLRPVDFATDGIFLCGMAHYPKPVEETVAQAKAAAARAVRVLSQTSVTVDGVVSHVDEARCRGCGACEAACPFGAVSLVENAEGIKVAVVQQALCKGCSACATACPTGAAGVAHYNNEVLAMVEAALEEV